MVLCSALDLSDYFARRLLSQSAFGDQLFGAQGFPLETLFTRELLAEAIGKVPMMEPKDQKAVSSDPHL